MGLKRGPLSLMSTTEELLERKSNGSSLESREYGRRDPSGHPSFCPDWKIWRCVKYQLSLLVSIVLALSALLVLLLVSWGRD
jgi:hypothetical protein